MSLEKESWDLEKYKFSQAFNVEATRINNLRNSYPDNKRYVESEENLAAIQEFFKFADDYVHALKTRINLLKLENHLLQQDYMRALDDDIKLTEILLNKPKVA